MLTQIYVKNFILIDEVQLTLYPHMSAFTGETGAGKSILMDAIGILKGDRVSSDMIKQGCDKAIIEGVFEISSNSMAYKLLEEAGYDIEDGVLILYIIGVKPQHRAAAFFMMMNRASVG